VFLAPFRGARCFGNQTGGLRVAAAPGYSLATFRVGWRDHERERVPYPPFRSGAARRPFCNPSGCLGSPQPNGLADRSRGLSSAIPPDCRDDWFLHPEGVTESEVWPPSSSEIFRIVFHAVLFEPPFKFIDEGWQPFRLTGIGDPPGLRTGAEVSGLEARTAGGQFTSL